MKSISLFAGILLFSLPSFAQTAHSHSTRGTVSSTQRVPAAKGDAGAATVISSANRDTQNQQKQLAQLERGSAQPKHTPTTHSQRVVLPKEHEAANPPINFSHQPPKRTTKAPGTSSAYAGTAHGSRK
jgi:hypothetical protein